MYSEGLSDTYTSTGTLSRILQQGYNKEAEECEEEYDEDDDEFEYEEI